MMVVSWHFGNYTFATDREYLAAQQYQELSDLCKKDGGTLSESDIRWTEYMTLAWARKLVVKNTSCDQLLTLAAERSAEARKWDDRKKESMDVDVPLVGYHLVGSDYIVTACVVGLAFLCWLCLTLNTVLSRLCEVHNHPDLFRGNTVQAIPALFSVIWPGIQNMGGVGFVDVALAAVPIASAVVLVSDVASLYEKSYAPGWDAFSAFAVGRIVLLLAVILVSAEIALLSRATITHIRNVLFLLEWTERSLYHVVRGVFAEFDVFLGEGVNEVVYERAGSGKYQVTFFLRPEVKVDAKAERSLLPVLSFSGSVDFWKQARSLSEPAAKAAIDTIDRTFVGMDAPVLARPEITNENWVWGEKCYRTRRVINKDVAIARLRFFAWLFGGPGSNDIRGDIVRALECYSREVTAKEKPSEVSKPKSEESPDGTTAEGKPSEVSEPKTAEESSNTTVAPPPPEVSKPQSLSEAEKVAGRLKRIATLIRDEDEGIPEPKDGDAWKTWAGRWVLEIGSYEEREKKKNVKCTKPEKVGAE